MFNYSQEDQHGGGGGGSSNHFENQPFGDFDHHEAIQSWARFPFDEQPSSPFGGPSSTHGLDDPDHAFEPSTGMDWMSSVSHPNHHHLGGFQNDPFGDSLPDTSHINFDQVRPGPAPGENGVSRLVAQFENKSYVPPLPPRRIEHTVGNTDVHMGNSPAEESSYFGSLSATTSLNRVASPVASPGESHFGSFHSRVTSPGATTPGSLPFGGFQDYPRVSSPMEAAPTSEPFGSLGGLMGGFHGQAGSDFHRGPIFQQHIQTPMSEQPMATSPLGAPMSSSMQPQQRTPGASNNTPGFSIWRPPSSETPKPHMNLMHTPQQSPLPLSKPPVPTTPKPTIGSQFILELNPASKLKSKAPPKPPRPPKAPAASLAAGANIKQEAATPQLIDFSSGPDQSITDQEGSTSSAPPKSLAGTRPSREQVPAEAWEQSKEIIRQLYLVERKPLKEVMSIMAEKYNFAATPKMYKTRFSQWGFVKNNTEDEVKRLLSMKFQRDAEGKVTEFRRNGKVVNLGTYLKRKNKTEYDLIDFEMAGQLPEHVRCRTPTPPPLMGYSRSPELLRAQELVVGSMRKAFLQGRHWEVETNTAVEWITLMTWGAHSSDMLVEANFFFEAKDADQGGMCLMNAFNQLESDLKKLSPQGIMEVLLGMVHRDSGLITALCKYLAAYSSTNYERAHPLRQIFTCLYEVQQKHGSVTVSDLLWNSLPNIACELEAIYGKRHPYVARTWIDLGLYYEHVSVERLEGLIVELRSVQQQLEQQHGQRHSEALQVRDACLQAHYLVDPKSRETKTAANSLWQTWKSMDLVFPIRGGRPNAFCFHSPDKISPWSKRCRRRYESIMAAIEEHVDVKAHPYFEEDFHTREHGLESTDSWAASMSSNLSTSWRYI